jgi:hypothetical protein
VIDITIVELEKVNEKIWNETLAKVVPDGTLFQSTYWADYMKKTYGDQPIWLAHFGRKGNMLGLLLAIESCYARHATLSSSDKRALLFNTTFRKTMVLVFQKVLPSISWENGPVIFSERSQETQLDRSIDKELLYKKMVEGIVKIALKKGCYAIKFARPAFSDDQPGIFSAMGFRKRRMGTLLVSLEGPIEALWNRVEKDARRTVRRGIEQGVTTYRASKVGELEKDFYSLNAQSSKRAHTKVYPLDHFKSLWNYFSPMKKAAVFIARIKDKPVAAALYLMHNQIIHIFALGDSDDARVNKIYANEVLMWDVIKWASEQGFKYFDHSGVELYKIDAGDNKAGSIFRFKSKWGGQLVQYHDYDKLLQKQKIVCLLNRILADPSIHN